MGTEEAWDWDWRGGEKEPMLRANGPTERRAEKNAGKNKCLGTEEE